MRKQARVGVADSTALLVCQDYADAWLAGCSEWQRFIAHPCGSEVLGTLTVAQAEFGDDALHQLRKREAQERRAAAEAASMKIDTNQIPLGQRVVVRFRSKPCSPHP